MLRTNFYCCLLALCVLSCGSSKRDDVDLGWFTFGQAGDGSLVAMGNGQYEIIDEANRSTHRSAFDASTLDALEELFRSDALEHYRQYSVEDSNNSCFRGDGYVLDVDSLTGCWMLDEVSDPQTRDMLDYLITLYDQALATSRDARHR